MLPVSPLRYPGGKGQLSVFFDSLIKRNDLVDGVYAEAFAGGAAVGIHLLLENTVSRIVINDLDRSVWAFWKALLSRTEEFVSEVMASPLTVEEWKRQKNIQRDPQSKVFDLGFSTFYLNRTNRSGVLNGGLIGGLRQDGAYRMDARFNRDALAARIRAIGELSHKVELHNLDAEEFIESVLPGLPTKNTLVYFDPPYYTQGRQLYMTYYDPEDHRRLARAIKSIPHHWCVTYDDVREVRVLYRSHRMRKYQLDYSAHERKKGAEFMVFSKTLSVPRSLKHL